MNPIIALPKLKKGPIQQRIYLTISLIIAKFVFVAELNKRKKKTASGPTTPANHINSLNSYETTNL